MAVITNTHIVDNYRPLTHSKSHPNMKFGPFNIKKSRDMSNLAVHLNPIHRETSLESIPFSETKEVYEIHKGKVPTTLQKTHLLKKVINNGVLHVK